jgi:TatA/E family protein of Tat protein translocase
MSPDSLLSEVMGFEMIAILALAMLLFGPKKLPEISRTIGKFMAEFRRAGYEFKAQIEDEVRKLEIQADQEKSAKAQPGSGPGERPRQIMPPSVGETVGMRRPSVIHDDSFDSVASTMDAGNEGSDGKAENQRQENVEAMKGPNA